MWEDRRQQWQQWQQMETWMANALEMHEASGKIASEIGTHVSAASPEVVLTETTEKAQHVT